MHLQERDPLELEEWLPLYNRICDEFGFDKQADIDAANKLASILAGSGASPLARLRDGFPKRVLVCGGGENLADEISSLRIDVFVVAADSAASVLVDSGLDAQMVVTDLDGVVEDQIDMNRRGATVFVHAHGDNKDAIEEYARRFPGPLVGTCQCAPPPGLVNFGGFTDGDRAACICSELGAREVLLAGFDFERPSEKAGRSKDVKRRKLAWAKIILDSLSRRGIRIGPALESADLR